MPIVALRPQLWTELLDLNYNNLQDFGDCDFYGECSVSVDSTDTSSENAVYINGIDQALKELGLKGYSDRRPEKISAQFAKAYFERTVAFLEPFLDARFEALERDIEADYKQERKRTRNKHRGFWNLRMQPLLDRVGPGFQRLALVGSTNGLTPEVTRKFYALLRFISLVDAQEAACILEACWMVAAICECDPSMQFFSNH